MFTCRWYQWWRVSPSGYLTKNIYPNHPNDTNFMLLSRQSLLRILMQTMRSYGEWLSYHLQNFVRFFSGTPCISILLTELWSWRLLLMCTGRHNDSLREGALHRNNGHDDGDFCQMPSGSSRVSETVCQLASWHRYRSSAYTVWMSADHLYCPVPVFQTPFNLFSAVVVHGCPENGFCEHANIVCNAELRNFEVLQYVLLNRARNYIALVLLYRQHLSFFTARCYAWRELAVARCLSVLPSVCLSHAGIVSKRLNVSSDFFHRRVATPL